MRSESLAEIDLMGVPIVLAGFAEARVMELVKEGEGFGEKRFVFELLEVEPLTGFVPPGGRWVAKQIAGFESRFDLVADTGFGAIDLIDELIETPVLAGRLGEIVARKHFFDFLAEMSEVLLSSRPHDDLGIGDEFLEFLVKDIGRFIGAAGDKNGTPAKNLLGGRGDEGEGFPGSGRALANTQGKGVDGLEEIKLGLRQEGGDTLGIASFFCLRGGGLRFPDEGSQGRRVGFFGDGGDKFQLF